MKAARYVVLAGLLVIMPVEQVLAQPRIDDFRASATSITQGDEVTLTWNTSQADSVALLPEGTVAARGSRFVSPEQDTEYVLMAYGPGGPVAQSIPITVTPDWDNMDWTDLSLDQQSQWGTLGWDRQSWDANTPPPSDSKSWEALSDAERNAAQALGFTEATWNAS